MDELEELRQKKYQQLQQQYQQQAEQEQMKKQLISKLLDQKARERLANLRLANPELAEKAEQVIIYMSQSGQLRGVISDELLKQILMKLTEKRETKITRK